LNKLAEKSRKLSTLPE